MNTKLFSAALLASAAFTLAPTASASLLVGWYDFNNTSAPESADVNATGFSGSFAKPVTPRDVGGDNGGGSGLFYGDSGIASGSGNDGFLRTGAGYGAALTLQNNSGSAVTLDSLFFDAALKFNASLGVSYRMGTSGTWLSLANFSPVLGFDASITPGTEFDFSDISLSLIGAVPVLGSGNTIQFAFVAGTGAIDNIAITAITAIPEPAGLLALACLLGSGLMLRSRPRMAAAAATA